MLRENSEGASSEDEGGAATRDEAAPDSEGHKGNRQRDAQDTLAGNVAVLIVACLTVRVPVIYMGFVR